MLSKLFITATMALLATALDTNSTSTDLATQVLRMRDLTNVGYILHRDIVAVNNNPNDRRVTVATIDAITNQAQMFQDLNNAPATKRSAYTEEQQAQIAGAYAFYMETNSAMLGAAVDKHFAIVAHNAGHLVGVALNNSMFATRSWSEAVLASIPAQTSAMTVQKSVHDNGYQMAVDLYLNGPAGLTDAA